MNIIFLIKIFDIQVLRVVQEFDGIELQSDWSGSVLGVLIVGQKSDQFDLQYVCEHLR